MERFCEKCGSLVSGDVKYCPTCGAALPGAVDLDKPAGEPQNTQTVQPNFVYTNQPTGGYGAPQYGQPINQYNQPQQAMTVGQWVGTILLCTCLGMVSFVLTIVWAFSSSTPEPKKSFCKGYFYVQLIMIGVSILLMILIFGVFGLAFGDVLRDSGYNYSYRF